MKGNFFKKLGIKITGFIGLTLLASGLGGITSHAAMDGVNYVDPEKIYDEANSLIISKNADIKNFSVETTNAIPERKVNEKGSADIYRSFDKKYGSIRLTFGSNTKPTISKDSKIIVTQEKVGSYKGKSINVKQVFSNFTLRSTYLGEEAPYFEISESPFSGYRFVGFPTFKYDVEFTYSDTGEMVSFANGDSFLSFNSLNGATDPAVKLTNRFESVKYYNSNNKKDVYVTKDTNIGYGNPSKISVTSPDRTTNNYNGDMYGGFSNDFTDYLGGETFAKNTAQFKLSGDTQSFQIGSNTGEAWNALSTATLFNVKVPTPTKTVEDDNGIDLNGEIVENGEVLNYKIHQKVNNLGVDILERYKTFVINDTLDKNVTYKSAVLTDGSGNEIKNAGTITHDSANNKVTFTASKEFLEKMELNGNTYILQIKAVVNDSVKGGTVIKNVGKTTINNQNETTNEVQNPVVVPKEIDPTKTEKNDKGIDYNGKAVYAGDTLVFDVSQKVHELGIDLKNPYSTFGLYDTLDNRLEYVSATILKDGKEVKGAKDLSFDKEKNRVAFTADKDFLKTMEYKNETYTLRITTKVSTNIAEGDTITNKAESLVNDTTRETNEVKNPIKVPKGSLEIAKVTNQLTGIKVSMDQNYEKKDKKVSALSSVFGVTANAEETTDSSSDFNADLNYSNDFVYDKKPQGGVTYELLPNKDITYGNGKLIHKAGTSLAKQTTDNKTGLAVFNDLYEGEYVLYERSAPVGIQVDPTPIYVTLKAGDKQQEFTVEQGHEDPLQEVELKGTKEFEQEDGSFKVQAGATFGLYLNDEYTINSNEADTTGDTSTSESSTQATIETKESTKPDVKPLAESTTAESSLEESTSTSTTEPNDSNEETSKTIPKDQLISEMKVNDDGSLSYKGILIPNQRYYAKEIKTSEGYQLLQDKLTFIYQPVNNNAVADITLYAQGYVTDGVYIPYKDVEALKLPVKDVLSKSDKYKEPTEDQKQPLKNILITENSIKKSIKKTDGTLVDSYDVLEDKEKITFLGTATLGNSNNPDDSIVLEDNLPKGLTYESMKVFDEKQQDITSKVKIDTKDQKLTVTVNKEYAKTIKSTKLYWEVLTTYHASEDVAGKKLENEMILNVGDKKYNDKVTLQTPKLIKKSLPSTGEIIRNYGWLGLLLIVGVFLVAYVKHKKNKSNNEIES